MKKLQSNRGVSILFALLIFLVCAVVASVVLAAATASSGRLSGLTEMDRRYYSVTSAAEVFRDALEREGRISVVRSETTVTETKTTYLNTEDGAKVQGDPVEKKTVYTTDYLNDQDLLLDPQLTMLQEFACSMVLGTGGYGGGEVLEAFELELRLSADEMDEEILEDLAVDVLVMLRADGTLELVFSNAGAAGDDTYSLRMTFAADVDEYTVEQTVEEAPVIKRDEEANSFTETVTVRETIDRVTTITWYMTGMEKVVSSHEAS